MEELPHSRSRGVKSGLQSEGKSEIHIGLENIQVRTMSNSQNQGNVLITYFPQTHKKVQTFNAKTRPKIY